MKSKGKTAKIIGSSLFQGGGENNVNMGTLEYGEYVNEYAEIMGGNNGKYWGRGKYWGGGNTGNTGDGNTGDVYGNTGDVYDFTGK